MKKYGVLLLFALMLFSLPAQASDMPDLTADCTITVGSKAFTKERLFDRDYATYWNGEDSGKTVTIHSPEAIHGLYICWLSAPRAWAVEEKINGQWQKTSFEASPFQHAYYPLNGAKEIRLKPEGKSKKWFGMSEIFILGKGELPPYVQTWKEAERGSDLLLLFAHPDDEALFFGGTLPYYAGELGLNVTACAFTPATPLRVSELLNSLWTMGVKNYPVLGPFHDTYSLKLDKAYRDFGKSKVQRFAVELLRKYQPKVIVSHDVDGEYGHGMHQLCADMMLYAFDAAADAGKFSQSAKEFGTWQASKLYLHLYKDNPIVMDWDKPLRAFSGKTGYEVAKLGYAQHLSQHRYEQYQVEPKDSENSSYHFGLAKSTVGLDTLKNDFFENIDLGTFQVEGE